ncbi:MAG: AAA family ATPase, partial [Chloroflexota bacterium]|nr:AAA family ATPase [Chloroflexota bacterium]
AVPAIRGCPYHDDPLWPKEFLCARCRSANNAAKEYGVEFVPGHRRFSRIQGNEYTNEAKLLGLKDIQAIARGRSPSDPRVFTGTGVLRANRGILFIDELPAIRTKVQVLLHPVLEEKKAILEEYNWEHFLDIVLAATGNPSGFSHVNEVPRPLLDRLELIYMDLPEEDTEREIMLREKFAVHEHHADSPVEHDDLSYPTLDDIERRVVAPWWTMDLINAAVRQSRTCPFLDKSASIRATTKAIDHTYASVELDGRRVARLDDVARGLRLALRGRIGLRADLIDYESPKATLKKTDELSQYLLCSALADFDFRFTGDKDRLAVEIDSVLADGMENLTTTLQRCPELSSAIGQLTGLARDKLTDGFNETERALAQHPDRLDPQTLDEYNRSALELVCNLAWHRRVVGDQVADTVFVPRAGTFA